jgi:hypothetical protein
MMASKSVLLFGMPALLLALPVFAERPVKATIPFDFTVGGTSMAAGDYDVEFPIPGTVLVRRQDRKASCTVIVHGVYASRTPEEGKLVFNKYGESHFLSQVWIPGYNQGKQLVTSKAEREMIAQSRGAVVTTVAAKRR